MKCIRVYLVPRSASTSVFVLFSPFHPRLHVLFPFLFPPFSFLFNFLQLCVHGLEYSCVCASTWLGCPCIGADDRVGLLELCSGLENGCEWRFPPSTLMSANLLILQHEVFMAWP